jgi:hypothetical protein
MSRYSRGSLTDILVHSTVAGVGLSLGRDAYRVTKNNFLLLVAAAVALAGTAYGVWNMTRGHERGPLATFFLTFLANFILIIVSFAIFMFVVFGIADQGDPNSADYNMSIIYGGVIIQIIFAATGFLIGRSHRAKRLEAFAVAAHNADYLSREGFREVGGRESVMIDRSGQELVLEDIRQDAAVFKVKGRRGVRAKILLDNTGRMTTYMPA